MKEFVVEYLKDSLTQSEDELRNGSIIGSIVINSYSDKFENFEFKHLEKVLNRSYTHKIAILSLSHVIYDKKIRKKFDSLIKRSINDPYSLVRKAAAFSEPGFWGMEKKKNQLKKIKSLAKKVKKKKLNKNYLEGVLLGLGINSLDFDSETFGEILNFYALVQETYSNDETILTSLSYGLSIFCVATRQVEQGLSILFNILESKIKRVRTANAEALSFLTPFVELNQSLEIIEALISHPAHQESWPLNLAILHTYLNHFKSETKILLLNKVHESSRESLGHEVLFLLEKIKNSRAPLRVIEAGLESDYSQLRLASLFSTYYAEKNKDRFKKNESEFIKFADLIGGLLKDPSGSIRSFALYRLLSYSLTLNTSKYMDYFRSHLNDQISRNRFVSGVALTYLTALYNPNQLLDIKNELYATRNMSVMKGVLVGMAMGVNPAINESDTADEMILGLLELSGADSAVGFILAQSCFQ